MKKKNIINKLIVAPLVMGFMSCTGNYMDINSNPYQPGDLTPDRDAVPWQQLQSERGFCHE